MTEQEEHYIHFVSSIGNLNSAWRILHEIKKNKDSPLVWAAFQFALVEYAKPYTNSRGVFLNLKGKNTNYKLDNSYIPSAHLELHNKIINSRNQIFAHADLTVKEANLYVKNTQYGKIVTVVENIIYGTEELPKIDSIIELIEKTLETMYIEVKRLELLLPLTS